MKGILVIFFIVIPAGVSACPFCDSATAARIRSLLFGPDLLVNLGLSVLPFLVSFLVAYFVFRGSPKNKSS